MTLRLNPHYPLVWRTPQTIQIGIDHPLVVIPDVGAGLEHVIAALVSGVPRSGAMMLGRRAGTSDAATLALLEALRPALIVTAERAPSDSGAEPAAAPPPRPPALVCVDGDGPTALRIRALLRDLGLLVVGPDHGTAEPHPVEPHPAALDRAALNPPAPNPPAPNPPALAVIVGHYALEPARHGRWLRADVPHLPVVFSDSEVRVGPLVEPGDGGPCLYCLELAHLDSDPAWPAIACQLLTRTAPTETRRLGIDVATRVAGLVQDRLNSGRSSLARTSLVLDVVSGAIRRREHRPHERCGCLSLPGTVTAPAGTAAGGRAPTSSTRVADVPG